ncbi:Mechanosensitive ion channel protein 10 [Morus notabilis]|uniref:Mechanosensitive ion channel protein n=2 Tax=Morus notabilis TaxID=981085 RepID=W9R6V9_9ROSA|nr:mechanosensitive ion channel protein 10 [Morus notabilis]XP_024022692.1 mechanosensitive ion channel protein 10 [Morus notabilis]EXB74868.1 Mechanosensitive ion channel protein 10 [Morus notabilis]
MEAREKTSSNGGETSMSEKKTENGSAVVVEIRTESESAKKGSESPFPKQLTKTDSPQKVSTESTGISKSVPVSCPSPEIGRFSPSPNKPPKIPATYDTLTRRKSLNRSVFSRPKSRFGEPSVPIDSAMFEEHNGSGQIGLGSPYRGSFNRASPNNVSTARTVSIAQKSAAEDEDEEIYKKVVLSEEKRKRVKAKVLVEWIMFLFLVVCLTASLTVEGLESTKLWELELWKWVVLVMVIICGMLVTNWFMRIVVFVIERNFLLRKKVLYFVHGLKKSVQVFIWLCLVLLTWVLVFNHGVKRPETANKILHYVTWTLVTLLIGGFIWLIKTLLLKILASNFHVNTFFDRIQESIFHQYVLQTLSGPALIEEAEKVGRSPSMGQLSFRSTKKGKAAKTIETIDMANLHKMKQEKVSAWTMKVLVDAVSSSGLSTISNTLDEMENGAMEQMDKEITSEMEATAAAYHIFRNVAQPGSKFIDEDDLLRFMIKEEVDIVLPLFATDNGRIDRKALTDWVIKVYNGRKALAHALNDTKTAVKQLNKLVTGILFVVIILVWLLLMEIATTKVLVFLSSQLVVAAFMFGNTCKTIFEAIVFVFVMHPFDVGDRCVIDGVPLLVEEMNILNTVFLKLNNEKVYYPNSVLSTKPISNYYRSSDMGDTVEFSIDFMTPVEKIGHLKDKINKYIEKNPQQWHPNHSVVVVEIENVNKLKMALYVNHTISFQEYGEKNKRRTELVMEIKRIFEELNIKYYLLPQTVHLGQSVSDTNAIQR